MRDDASLHAACCRTCSWKYEVEVSQVLVDFELQISGVHRGAAQATRIIRQHSTARRRACGVRFPGAQELRQIGVCRSVAALIDPWAALEADHQLGIRAVSKRGRSLRAFQGRGEIHIEVDCAERREWNGENDSIVSTRNEARRRVERQLNPAAGRLVTAVSIMPS